MVKMSSLLIGFAFWNKFTVRVVPNLETPPYKNTQVTLFSIHYLTCFEKNISYIPSDDEGLQSALFINYRNIQSIIFLCKYDKIPHRW
jgi:hypothetical protein